MSPPWTHLPIGRRIVFFEIRAQTGQTNTQITRRHSDPLFKITDASSHAPNNDSWASSFTLCFFFFLTFFCDEQNGVVGEWGPQWRKQRDSFIYFFFISTIIGANSNACVAHHLKNTNQWGNYTHTTMPNHTRNNAGAMSVRSQPT